MLTAVRTQSSWISIDDCVTICNIDTALNQIHCMIFWKCMSSLWIIIKCCRDLIFQPLCFRATETPWRLHDGGCCNEQHAGKLWLHMVASFEVYTENNEVEAISFLQQKKRLLVTSRWLTLIYAVFLGAHTYVLHTHNIMLHWNNTYYIHTQLLELHSWISVAVLLQSSLNDLFTATR